jgi:SRSO17 transposase
MIEGGGDLTGGAAMSLLEHPDAQAILADATVTREQVRDCQDRVATFLQRYLPRSYRAEQRTHATLVIRGLLSGLQRKTCEPIAVEAGAHRKPVQNFVGAGGWDDEAVMAELRGHVREVLADPRAILILDPSGFRAGVSKVGGKSRTTKPADPSP